MSRSPLPLSIYGHTTILVQLTNFKPIILGRHTQVCSGFSTPEFLDETDYIDPFQPGFRPGDRTETAVIDDLRTASLLIISDLSAAFDTIKMVYLGASG